MSFRPVRDAISNKVDSSCRTPAKADFSLHGLCPHAHALLQRAGGEKHWHGPPTHTMCMLRADTPTGSVPLPCSIWACHPTSVSMTTYFLSTQPLPQSFMLKAFVCSVRKAPVTPTLCLPCLHKGQASQAGVSSQGGKDRLPSEDAAARKKMVPRSLISPLYLAIKMTRMLYLAQARL